MRNQSKLKGPEEPEKGTALLHNVSTSGAAATAAQAQAPAQARSSSASTAQAPQVQRKQPRTAQNCKNDLQAHQLGSRLSPVLRGEMVQQVRGISVFTMLLLKTCCFTILMDVAQKKINWFNTNPFLMTSYQTCPF